MSFFNAIQGIQQANTSINDLCGEFMLWTHVLPTQKQFSANENILLRLEPTELEAHSRYNTNNPDRNVKSIVEKVKAEIGTLQMKGKIPKKIKFSITGKQDKHDTIGYGTISIKISALPENIALFNDDVLQKKAKLKDIDPYYKMSFRTAKDMSEPLHNLRLFIRALISQYQEPRTDISNLSSSAVVKFWDIGIQPKLAAERTYELEPFLSSTYQPPEAKPFIQPKQQASNETPLGRTSVVTTAKGGQSIETGFKVIDTSELIASNFSDGRINPDFPAELQPRDRSRQASIMQINKLANDIKPHLLTDSGLSSQGAPIVGPDRVVESGNGRVIALTKAYKEGKANHYRQYLIDNATSFNLDPQQISAMKQPVLVRERVSNVDRVKFAMDSNLSDMQQMSAAETAWVDAERIDQRMMGLFEPNDSGNLMADSNKAFIHSFLTEIGDNSTAGLITEDGRYTRQLLDRVQNAVFAKAYKNDRLVKLAAEEADPEIRNILTALNSAAGEFVEMQYLDSEVHKQASDLVVGAIDDVKENPRLAESALNSLIQATEAVRRARATGQDLKTMLSQQDLLNDINEESKALALFISANNRSAKKMSLAFKTLAQEINQELQNEGMALGDLFGDDDLPQITLIDILGRVSQKLESEGVQNSFILESSRIDKAAHQAATSPLNKMPEPTEAQKRAGNYKKGHVVFLGLPITIENPKGSIRTGKDKTGQAWSIKMNHHYGDIRGTKGADGDPLDVFIGDNEKSQTVFIVNQTHTDGSFDEHKIMLGFDSKSEAEAAYKANYEEGWSNYSSVIEIPFKGFQQWIRTGDNDKPMR